MVDSYVQVAPDSSGKKIRNLENVIPFSDGSQQVVETQVVATVDECGNVVNPGNDMVVHLLQQVLEQMHLMNVYLHQIVSTTDG